MHCMEYRQPMTHLSKINICGVTLDKKYSHVYQTFQGLGLGNTVTWCDKNLITFKYHT